MLNGYQGKVYTVDARKISVQALGKYFPNSPMLAAAVAVSGVMKKMLLFLKCELLISINLQRNQKSTGKI